MLFNLFLMILQEVLMLLEDAEKHHVGYACRPFWRSLVDGMNWLKKALEILSPCNNNSDIKKFALSDVKEALRQYKVLLLLFINMLYIFRPFFSSMYYIYDII